MELGDRMHKGVAIFELALEKRFDCVSHEIQLCILESIRNGTVFRQGVPLAYRNCTTRLIVKKLKLGWAIEEQRSFGTPELPSSPFIYWCAH